MRKLLIATLLLGAIFYLFLAGNAEPVNGAPPIAVASKVSAPSAPGSETLIPFNGIVSPMLTTGYSPAKSGSPDERAVALLQLADRNKAQLYNVLWQALEPADMGGADFREFILATLEEMGNDVPGEVLAALVQNAPTTALRLRALRLLNEASQELSADGFNQALEDQDPAIRQSALALLDEMGTAALLDALVEAVLDRNRAVRLMAFTTMEEIHELIPVWEIADMFVDDPDPQIRMRALELLSLGDPHRAIDHLVFALGDPNPQISALAEDLLAELEQEPS